MALDPYGDEGPPSIKVDSSTLGPNTIFNLRCKQCSKLLAEFVSRPFQIRCPRCKTIRGSGPALPTNLPTS